MGRDWEINKGSEHERRVRAVNTGSEYGIRGWAINTDSEYRRSEGVMV